MSNKKINALMVLVGVLFAGHGFSQTGAIRKSILLNENWRSIADDQNINAYTGFESPAFNDRNWKKVNVPHNWDGYEGYRRMLHGNRHGYAWYRKTFSTAEKQTGKRFFLYFDGVGSYGTIWLNGKKVGYHAGGRTTFTLDVTNVIKLNNQSNILAVRADHPANIQDLPWVDGGCSTERGFSEGSQPMGIFRPVHLLVTNNIRIEPFGVHVWNDEKVSEKSASLNLTTELKNYTKLVKFITVLSQLFDKNGNKIEEIKTRQKLLGGQTVVVSQKTSVLKKPILWSLENPYLYTVKTSLIENKEVIDELNTPYGIRWISWPVGQTGNSKQFLLNGKPVFINGIAEYEHLIGQSHAFSNEQIKSRVMQIKSAGFNAFRDAHQPHNLLYQEYWDKLGILSWTQMAAHIWYDTPEFRANFKLLLTDWVKERRNSPSVVLWGLENESTLPEDFAKECTELIRKLDPTASVQRKVTTCNGGKGTDWDVPQNWTGTYGGNPLTYAEDVQRQVLIGEYGAWRTLDLHTEGPFVQNGAYSENNMTQLMETKVRLAESVRDKTAGQFFWLFSSHDNPGRVQGGEGMRELDRVGPVNYKGLFTPWEEPLDVFYMFRANYAPKETEPMVYIVSHTWANRWLKPGKKDSITVYSNCDEVELFNDVNGVSLGKRTRGGIGTHFQWDGVNIQYNVLYAVGYVAGKAVAKDYIVLNNLPQAPHFNDFMTGARNITAAEKGYNYLYRVNCGGPEYKDQNGQLWSADRQLKGGNTFGSSSWTADFPGIPAFFASQRRTFDPIQGTLDWKLFQTFRYGRDKLNYQFPVPDGEYLVELYFTEPWLGAGGGMDCEGMRLFDVAVNGETVLKNVDIWQEAGHDGALKKTVRTRIRGGRLELSFPQVKSGQAVISAIAIASTNATIKAVEASPSLVSVLPGTKLGVSTWMDMGDRQYADQDVFFNSLPSNLYGAEWIQANAKVKPDNFKLNEEADVYVATDESIVDRLAWLVDYEDTKTFIENSNAKKFKVFRKRYSKDELVILGQNDPAAAMYTVAILPASKLEPAYDLKSTATYKASQAKLIGGAVKEVAMDKERVALKKAGDALEWTISTGVADTYSLTIKYHNPFEQSLYGKIEFLTAEGIVMRVVECAEFSATKKGKWNYYNTSTGSMINAGTYKVRLTAENANGLILDGLDVQ